MMYSFFCLFLGLPFFKRMHPSLSTLIPSLSHYPIFTPVLLIRAHRARQFVCNPIRGMDQREEGEREVEMEGGDILKI